MLLLVWSSKRRFNIFIHFYSIIKYRTSTLQGFNIWWMCTENAFHAVALHPPAATKCTPTSTPTPLPSGDTCPYHVHLLGLSIHSRFTVSPTFILACIPVQNLDASHHCRLTQESISSPVWSSDNMHTRCWYLGVYLAITASMLTTQISWTAVLSSGDAACFFVEKGGLL